MFLLRPFIVNFSINGGGESTSGDGLGKVTAAERIKIRGMVSGDGVACILLSKLIIHACK